MLDILALAIFCVACVVVAMLLYPDDHRQRGDSDALMQKYRWKKTERHPALDRDSEPGRRA